MAKTRSRPHADRLPVASAVSAGARLDPEGHPGHPILLEVILLDATGQPFLMPIRLPAGCARAVGVQLERTGRVASTLVGS